MIKVHKRLSSQLPVRGCCANWDKIQVRLTKHINANDSYIDEGVRLLELVQHAVITYKNLQAAEKGSFLKIVHSNTTWKDGKLHHEYRQSFDFIAKKTMSTYKKRPFFVRKTTVVYFGWGARIRTSDDGVRVRCLTAWRHPNKKNDN